MNHAVGKFTAGCLLATLMGCSGKPPINDLPEPTPVNQGTDPAQPAPEPGPVPQPNPAPETPANTGVQPLVRVDGDPVDWAGAMFDEPNAVRPQPDACTVDPTKPNAFLIGEVGKAQWGAHPLSNGSFMAPRVDIAVCNAGGETLTHLGHGSITLRLNAGEREDNLRLPELKPGEGVKLRLFSTHGAPKGVAEHWLADAGRWPTVRLDVGWGEQELGGATTAGDQFDQPRTLPDTPTLEQLRKWAWDQGTAPLGGGRQGEFFLFSPDAAYSITIDPFCGAGSGTLNAEGQQWHVYLSADGGPPQKIHSFGSMSHIGGYGVAFRAVPTHPITALLVEQYSSCANPQVHNVYHYDHATAEVYAAQMRHETGHTSGAAGARVEFTPEGKLVTKSYNNQGEQAGWHTFTYVWEPQQRVWSFESHKRED